MCDPVSGLIVASTLLTATGQMQQASASAAASTYQAQIGQMNAQISDKRARDAIDRGQIEEQKQRQKTSAIMGQQKAAMAANGVDLSFGSPLDTIVDTATLGELDALTIRSNAAREEYDFKVQAANQRAGAQLNTMQASAAKTGGWLSAGSTILGGATSVTKYKTTGKL